jgi:hypothetical protein
MKIKHSVTAFSVAVVALMFMTQSVRSAENVSPASTPGTPSVLPRPDFHFPGNVGRTFADSDPAQFPQPVQAPKGAPNVVLACLLSSPASSTG